MLYVKDSAKEINLHLDTENVFPAIQENLFWFPFKLNLYSSSPSQQQALLIHKSTRRASLGLLKSGQETKWHFCCTRPILWPGGSLLVNQGTLCWGPDCGLTIFSSAAGSHHQSIRTNIKLTNIKPSCLSELKAADFTLHGKGSVIPTSSFSC